MACSTEKTAVRERRIRQLILKGGEAAKVSYKLDTTRAPTIFPKLKKRPSIGLSSFGAISFK
jgi:hypothetical protein